MRARKSAFCQPERHQSGMIFLCARQSSSICPVSRSQPRRGVDRSPLHPETAQKTFLRRCELFQPIVNPAAARSVPDGRVILDGFDAEIMLHPNQAGSEMKRSNSLTRKNWRRDLACEVNAKSYSPDALVRVAAPFKATRVCRTSFATDFLLLVRLGKFSQSRVFACNSRIAVCVSGRCVVSR